jgi:hypothetical protein
MSRGKRVLSAFQSSFAVDLPFVKFRLGFVPLKPNLLSWRLRPKKGEVSEFPTHVQLLALTPRDIDVHWSTDYVGVAKVSALGLFCVLAPLLIFPLKKFSGAFWSSWVEVLGVCLVSVSLWLFAYVTFSRWSRRLRFYRSIPKKPSLGPLMRFNSGVFRNSANSSFEALATICSVAVFVSYVVLISGAVAPRFLPLSVVAEPSDLVKAERRSFEQCQPLAMRARAYPPQELEGGFVEKVCRPLPPSLISINGLSPSLQVWFPVIAFVSLSGGFFLLGAFYLTVLNSPRGWRKSKDPNDFPAATAEVKKWICNGLAPQHMEKVFLNFDSTISSNNPNVGESFGNVNAVRWIFMMHALFPGNDEGDGIPLVTAFFKRAFLPVLLTYSVLFLSPFAIAAFGLWDSAFKVPFVMSAIFWVLFAVGLFARILEALPTPVRTELNEVDGHEVDPEVMAFLQRYPKFRVMQKSLELFVGARSLQFLNILSISGGVTFITIIGAFN